MRITPLKVLGTSLLALALFGIVYLEPWFRTVLLASAFQGMQGRDTVSSISFDLPEKKWLSFSLPPYRPSVKLVANAIVNERPEIPVYDPLRFSLEYEFLDSIGKSIFKDTYYFETGLTLYRNASSGTPEPGWFFFDSTLTPTDPSSAIFDLEGLDAKELSKVRIRVHELDDRIIGVNARVYVKQRVSESRAEKEWQRLTAKEKVMLVRANVLGSQLLSPEEKINVLRERWAPIAPSGVAGVEYVQRKLFRLFDPPQRIPDEEILPEGEEVSPDYHATIPVPAPGGQVELLFQRSAREFDTSEMQAEVWWFGRELSERKQHSLLSRKKKVSFRESFDEGFIEIRSSAVASVNAFLVSGDKRTRILPEALYLRPYLVDQGQSIRYRLVSHQHPSQPLRVDLRRPVSSRGDTASGAQAKLLFRSEDGAVLGEHLLTPTDWRESLYDRALAPEGLKGVSDPVSFYFRAPQATSTVELASLSGDLLINLYNRPTELIPVSYVPEDYQFAERLESRRRIWHLLSSPDHKQRIKDGKTELLRVRLRPPEDDPLIVAGEYEFEQFLPSGKWIGRYVFSPYTPLDSERVELLSFLFSEVSRKEKIQFRGKAWEKEISPQLLALCSSEESGQIVVKINDSEVFSQTIRKFPALLTLPKIATGEHTIEVISDTNNVSTYINQSELNEREQLLMQFTQELSRAPLTYSLQKNEVQAETVSIRFYPFSKEQSPTRLQVRIDLPTDTNDTKPSLSTTYLRRDYVVTPSLKGEMVPMLDAKKRSVGGGELFFFPLGEDMSPGSYTLTVERMSGPAGLVRVSRVLPGRIEKQEIARTGALQDDE